MQNEFYFQPDTCIPGKLYYVKVKDIDSTTNYMSVKFVGYCPHPAEVIVRKGDRIKVIHRVYLLQKNAKK